MDRWVRCAKSFQTNLIWPSPVPYNGRYSVRPERKEEQEAADLHLFWVRPESEKVDQKLRGAAFRVLREEKTTEIRFTRGPEPAHRASKRFLEKHVFKKQQNNKTTLPFKNNTCLTLGTKLSTFLYDVPLFIIIYMLPLTAQRLVARARIERAYYTPHHY